MKKGIKLICDFLGMIAIIILFVYIVSMQFFPEKLKEALGYQSFVILTNSMEPTIPVGSLVISKNIEHVDRLQKDTIISFKVDRLGDEVVFTHYFKKKKVDETGRVRYYTQAENADRYDDYEIYEEDILGTYVFHIPYIGKFILFLQSPFALLELGIILIIMIIYNLLANKFDEEEKAKLALQEEDTGPHFQNNEESLIIEAVNIDGEAPYLQLMQENAVKSEEEETVPDAVPEAETEQLPDSTEAPEETISAKNVFSYCMNRPGSGGEQSAAGFSIEIFRDGTIWHKINSADGQEAEILTYSIGKKEVKKIRKLIKDNASAIRKLPKVLDNNASEGNYNTFSFMGQVITGRNVQAHDLKKEKKRNLYYYRKYKKSMKYENEVMYLFKQIGKILKEEGIKLKLNGVVVKKK